MSVQFFECSELGRIAFRDRQESNHDRRALAHPRDIEILEGVDSDKARAAIAIDIRLGQGANPIGVAKDLKFN